MVSRLAEKRRCGRDAALQGVDDFCPLACGRSLRSALGCYVAAPSGRKPGYHDDVVHQQRGAVNVTIHRLAHEVRRTLGELEAS